jgi:hypothetical protein
MIHSMRSKMGTVLAKSRWGLACCLILVGTSWASSQTRVREETRTTTTQVRRVSSVIGASVQLVAGGTFGKVEDVIINDQGCIDFVVVVFEDKLFAVPFTLTRVDFTTRVVSIEIERERLLRAPSFARDRFPDFSVNSEFGRSVHSFFRTEGGNRERGREARPPAETRPPDRKPADTRPPDRRPPDDRRPPTKEKETKDKDQKPTKDKD